MQEKRKQHVLFLRFYEWTFMNGGDHMYNCAHRGYSEKYPENTIVAFKNAILAHANGIEFDVQMTKDGKLVIMHDERVDRTTNGTGLVKEFSIEELKKLEISYDGGIERVPTLEEYFELVKDLRDFTTNIELKTGIFLYEGIEQEMVDMIRAYGLMDRVIISSFNHRSLAKVKRIAPELPVGTLTECQLVGGVEYIHRAGFQYIHPSAYGLTKEIVDGYHAKGIGVNVWTFDAYPYDVEELVRMGVDGIIHNDPEYVKKIVESDPDA